MRIIIYANLSLWLLILFIFSTLQLPGHTLFWSSVQNSGHGLVMACAAFIGISTIAINSNNRVSTQFFIISILFMLGVLIEAIQHISGRGADINDIVMNAAGLSVGVCFARCAYFDLSQSSTAAHALVGLLSITYCSWLPIYYFVADRSAPSLPVLANFENIFPKAKIRNYGSKSTVSDYRDRWVESNSKSMLVMFYPGRWPFFDLLEIPHNWSHYNSLSIDVYNTNKNSIPLNIRIDFQYKETSKRAVMVARRIAKQGHSTITVSFKELSTDINNGNISDFQNIVGLVFYVSKVKTTTPLYFDNIILLK